VGSRIVTADIACRCPLHEADEAEFCRTHALHGCAPCAYTQWRLDSDASDVEFVRLPGGSYAYLRRERNAA
jgi:hypothetical protein